MSNEQRFNLSKLSTADFIDELVQRLYQEDEKSAKVNERAIDLEQCVYFLLYPHSTPRTGGNTAFKQVEELLRPLQPQLRNPALYDLACKKAGVSGSKYVKERL